MNCNTTHYRANSSSVPGDPTYLLDYKKREILFEPKIASLVGDAVPFRTEDDCPAIEVEVRGAKRTLVLDSGSPALILFQNSPPGSRFASGFVHTNTGSEAAQIGTERFRLADGRVRRIKAAYLPGRGAGAHGLLPTSAFRWIYINNQERYALFSRD